MVFRRDSEGNIHEPPKRGVYEEERYRDLAHSLNKQEIEWMMDELKKLGKVKAVVIW